MATLAEALESKAGATDDETMADDPALDFAATVKDPEASEEEIASALRAAVMAIMSEE